MTLLAVDLGLYAGLAYFSGADLVWFRSQNFGTKTRLKRAIPMVLDECGPALRTVVVEGDRHLGELWQKCAEKRGASVTWVAPEEWRSVLLLPREMRDGATAKANALRIAREIIDASSARKPKRPMVDDVAEAICIGAWAVRSLRAG